MYHYVTNVEQKTGSGIAQLWVNIEQQSVTAKDHLYIPVSTKSLCVSRRDEQEQDKTAAWHGCHEQEKTGARKYISKAAGD